MARIHASSPSIFDAQKLSLELLPVGEENWYEFRVDGQRVIGFHVNKDNASYFAKVAALIDGVNDRLELIGGVSL